MSKQQEHISWTPEEWSKVAARAKALKDAKPEMSWPNIVVVCQDDIRPERRRFYFNKLSSLKPMFDCLDLDAEGNVKPPPPPSPPEPVAAPALAPAPVASTPQTESSVPAKSKVISLGELPTDVLVAELFKRADDLKVISNHIMESEARVSEAIAHNNKVLEGYTNRVNSVEELVLTCMKAMDTVAEQAKMVETVRDLVMEAGEKQKSQNDAILQAINLLDDSERAAVSRKVYDRVMREQDDMSDFAKEKIETFAKNRPHIAPIRFLLIGPFPKDIARIRERLPRSLNVDLIYGENSEQVKLPVNVNFCLVSGHADFSRRWQAALHTYGTDRAFRLENGSIGTFAHRIQVLSSQAPTHDNNGKAHAA